MAAGANADFLSLQLERVRPFLPVAYEREKGFGAKIKKVEGIEVSSRNLRLPIQVNPGGKFGYCTFAGTALGRGGASSTQVATLTPVGIRFNVELNRDVQYYTNSADKAIAQVLKKELENAVPEFHPSLDHGRGCAIGARVRREVGIEQDRSALAAQCGCAVAWLRDTLHRLRDGIQGFLAGSAGSLEPCRQIPWQGLPIGPAVPPAHMLEELTVES